MENGRGCIAKCQAFIPLNLVIPKPNAAEDPPHYSRL